MLLKRLSLFIVAICVSVAVYAFDVSGKKFRTTYSENGITVVNEMTFQPNGVIDSVMKITGEQPMRAQAYWQQEDEIVQSSADDTTWLVKKVVNGEKMLDLYDSGYYVMTFKEVKPTGTSTKKTAPRKKR